MMNEILDINNIPILNEAIWILINISSTQSDNVNIIRNTGILYKIIKFLSIDSNDLKENVFMYLCIYL